MHVDLKQMALGPNSQKTEAAINTESLSFPVNAGCSLFVPNTLGVLSWHAPTPSSPRNLASPTRGFSLESLRAYLAKTPFPQHFVQDKVINLQFQLQRGSWHIHLRFRRTVWWMVRFIHSIQRGLPGNSLGFCNGK